MPKKRLCLTISGVVQGVGFRPFVYRLATELQLTGWVHNTSRGVTIEVEGEKEQLTTFQQGLNSTHPPNAQIQTITTQWLEPVNYTNFTVKSSDISAVPSISVLPDLATCPDCLRELLDLGDRRYHYPFINCTNCGPRYTIIEALPYDRDRTTMRVFPMCPECQSEYKDPSSRRFHAQPNACPRCGPQLELLDIETHCRAKRSIALQEAVQAITRGDIVALKGLGGFQLLVDARNQEAVLRLRQRKQRPDKPFALLYPNLESLKLDCEVGSLEADLLQSPAAPIVLLRPHRNPHFPCAAVAHNCPTLGAMLPYTPLHHLLMAELSFPIVATSGNISDEPICIDNDEALSRLGQIADLFLVHNRPIVQPLDDSVVRVIGDRSVILRRARGYAPLPLLVEGKEGTKQVIAYGSQQKNTIALSIGNIIALSGHIGDLETVAAFKHFERVVKRLGELYLFRPEVIACDAHPDYLPTHFAQQSASSLNLPLIPVQHHYAHVLSCMADNGLVPPVLGIAWDGTGYGLDGTIWGGEFLRVSEGWERVAYLRPFLLPGGEKAMREPRRTALGVLWECLDSDLWKRTDLAPLQAFTPEEYPIFKSMLIKEINTPRTSSMGRLFDAVASLLNLEQTVSFEGQAAIALEALCTDCLCSRSYPFIVLEHGEIDWRPIINAILWDLNEGVPPARIAVSFHNTLAEMTVSIAQLVALPKVLLTGGCFQNRYLVECTIERLRQAGFIPYWHNQIPPNDGGLAVGQVMAARIYGRQCI